MVRKHSFHLCCQTSQSSKLIIGREAIILGFGTGLMRKFGPNLFGHPIRLNMSA